MPAYMLDADGVTCPDIDECATGTASCDSNATCANTPGAYTCTCEAGYTGDGYTCEALDSGGCGCRATDPRGSWLLVLACVGALRRRPRTTSPRVQGRAARIGATAGAAPGRPGVRSRGM